MHYNKVPARVSTLGHFEQTHVFNFCISYCISGPNSNDEYFGHFKNYD